MMKPVVAALLLPLLAVAEPAGPAKAPAAPPPVTTTAAAPRPSSDAVVTEVQLKQLFASGPLARALADLDAGRFDAAANGFERSRTPEGRYLRAIALVEGRHGEDAVEALASVEKELPAIADRVWYWRGRAQHVAGDFRGAAASFAEVPERSLLWADAQLARARALDTVGDRDGALAALAPILSLPAPDEVQRRDPSSDALLLAGRIRASSGSVSEVPWARRAFLECWSAHPLAPAAALCLSEMRNLPSPGNADPSPEERLRHAEALLDANRNVPALADLDEIVTRLPPPGPGEALACRAASARGRAYRRMRQHTRAIETLRTVVEGCDDPQLRVRALYVLASAASIVDPPQGVVWYRTLARDYPSHPYADDALFFAADLLSRAGQTDEALLALSDLVENHPQGDYRAEAIFRMAWLQKQAGSTTEALAALSRLERDYDGSDPYEYARAVYWQARLLAARGGEGDAARAREAWRALADRYPTDYYGLLARARLVEAKPGAAPAWRRQRAADAPASTRYQVGALAQDRHFRAGLQLYRMGLDRAASDELVAVDRKLLAKGDALLLVAELLDRAGDQKSSTRLVRVVGRAALREKPEGPALRIWKVAYPPAFRPEVERHAPRAGVPSDLLLALMREESGLDPAAVSAAGAVGLTQLMLPTAQGVAKKLKMRPITQADLMRPEVSIRLGATYFGGLLKHYRSEALALAAYNAGDTPVRRWLQQRGTLALDEFVEEIPIQETRGYVKRVLRSYGAYRYLYAAAGAQPLLIGQALPPSQ
jgi:soluble lytic murein transglycosylase